MTKTKKEKPLLIKDIMKNLPKLLQCGFCECNTINKEFEPDRKIIYKTTAEGKRKPVCVRCRILKFGKFGNTIRKDKPKYEEDLRDKEKIEIEKENYNVAVMAQASQKKTRTKMKPKSINKK